MRGKVLDYYIAGDKAGITPACAGKSQTEEALTVGEEDHPRVCGEKEEKGGRS